MDSEEAAKKEYLEEGQEAPVEAMEEGQEAPVEAVEAPTESEGLLKEDDGVMKDDLQKNDTWSDWLQKSTRPMVPRRYKLVTEDDALTTSIRSVRLAVMTSAINTKMLNPNYPIMVTPDAHPDSFPDTEPFEFNSATYFLPMCSLLGVAIASIFLGTISDKVGRKKVILVLAWVSCAGSIAKYFAKETFWAFCITQIVFGFFLGNLPVGMAYIGDVFTSKKDKEKELGMLVSYYVMGNSGGGIIAILMNGSGLFAPLWVGSAIIGLSAVYTSWYMIEPGDVRLIPVGKASSSDEEDEAPRPETIDQKSLWNIVAGALADNFGSTGLFPLCLSPLAIEQYMFNFTEAGEDPIMTYTGYQWLSVMVAGMVVPATMMTPWVFRKLGVAGTCVFGNAFTALLTFGLLMIGNANATTAAFAGFVAVLYVGFPFTVFSQLTTGPMLDVIAPQDKIGYVQGLNNAAMNFGMALAPWLFGILADAVGTNPAIWTGIGISLLAAAINTPLMFNPLFGKAEPLPPKSKRALEGEDSEFVEQAIKGEFVAPEVLFEVNYNRAIHGKAIIVPKVKSYEEDKESLSELMSHAEEMFQFKMEMNDRILSELNDPKSDRDATEFCGLLNAGLYGNEEVVQEHTDDLGRWIGAYLKDKGYNPHTQSLVIKQMVLSAFPPVREEQEYTPENLEDTLVKNRRVMNYYLEAQDKRKRNHTWSSVLGNGGGAPVFYS